MGRLRPLSAAGALQVRWQRLRFRRHGAWRSGSVSIGVDRSGATRPPTGCKPRRWSMNRGCISRTRPTSPDRTACTSSARRPRRRCIYSDCPRPAQTNPAPRFRRAHMRVDELDIASPAPDDQLLALNDALDRVAPWNRNKRNWRNFATSSASRSTKPLKFLAFPKPRPSVGGAGNY